MKNKNSIFIVLLFAYSLMTIAQDNSLFEKKEFIVQGDTLKYRILYPKDFDSGSEKTYALVLFLHGAGERGGDNEKQLTHGSSLFLDQVNRKEFPAIVIMPQCPKDDYWAQVAVDRSTYPIKLEFQFENGPTKALKLVIGLMDEFYDQAFTNKNQNYVMGLSMGGMGTYELLARKSDRFAGAIAICGAGDTDYVKNYAKKIPVWAFHGAKDNVINPMHSVKIISALLNEEALPRFTLYDFANHNSWDPAFAEPELLKWLFSNKLKNQ